MGRSLHGGKPSLGSLPPLGRLPTRRQSTQALDGAFMPPAPRLPSTSRIGSPGGKVTPPWPSEAKYPLL